MKTTGLKEEMSVKLEKLGLKYCISTMSQSFYNCSDMCNVLYNTIITGSNSILYGSRGYGKSEFISGFLDALDIPYVKITCYENMPVESLIGVPDMDSLNSGDFKIAVENSPLCSGKILVIEEMFDARPQTLAVLKDAMTSNTFNGVQLNFGCVIAATNSNPQSLAINPSIDAFINGRFRFKLNVKWPTHTKNDYLNLFYLKCNVKSENFDRIESLAKLCAYASKDSGKNISPRKALEIVDTVEKLGFSALAYMPEISSELYYELINDNELEKASLNCFKRLCKSLIKYKEYSLINEIQAIKLDGLMDDIGNSGINPFIRDEYIEYKAHTIVIHDEVPEFDEGHAKVLTINFETKINELISKLS